MRCPNCNSRNSTNARSCSECGRSLEVVCSACHSRCPGGSRFCGQCGHELSAPSTGHPEGASAPLGEQVRGGRERRQLTVLFCDLVDSTLMSSRLDAEDFGDLIGEYFQRCKAAFERFGGYVDREEGDSLRVYFGYPLARDDDAHRAVRAALEVIDGVRQLGVELDRPLEVHIGIHSGEVVAGEMAGPAGRPGPLVVGDVPNIAKRLEESAPRGAVYVGPSTYRLAESLFTWEGVGPLTLKGIPAPVSAYRAVRYRGMSRTIDLFDARVLTPMQDRREELALLQKRWASARRGRSQVVLVSGEPGIGKSRLVHAFVTALAGQTCTVLATQCQEQYVDSAWFPFVDLLKRQLGFDAERPASERAAELEAAFAAGRLPQPEALPLVAALLSLPPVGPALNLWPRLQRERTLDWLVHWILGGTSAKPLLLVLEDAHWADASTLDALALLMERATSRRALVLITYRPEFTPPWPLRSHMSQVSLSRLSAEETSEMVMSLAAGETLPPGLLFPITTRSDGVPLFVEELTKMLLESVAKLERDDAAALTNGARAVKIPETLRGSLVARLDHLGSAKGTAQIAAVLGREFSYKLIQAVSRHADNALLADLGQLIDAELLYQRGQPPTATYTFKHALVQEAAYLSLLKARRADYHERTARVLMREFPELAEAHPELVAQHCAEAGLVDEAVSHWHRAGERALEASADVEAVAHLRKALELLAASPREPKRIDGEVKCLVTLGSALMVVRGYGASEVEEAFARAYLLCEELGDHRNQLYKALTGLHTFYQVHGPLHRAVELAQRLVIIADETGDSLRRAQAHRCLGWSLFCSGSLQLGSDHLEIALGLFDQMRAQEHTRVHGADPQVLGFVNSALLACFVGRPDNALDRSERAIALARKLRQPLALAYALCMSAAVHCCRQDPERTLTLARDAMALSAEHALPYFAAWGSTLLGWALVHTGRHTDGLAALRKGLDDYRATGALLFEPSSLALLAESCLVAGLADEAREAVELAFKSPMFARDYFYSAELHRLRGRLIAKTGGDMAQAAACTRTALDLAQSQGAVALVERAEEQLAQLRTSMAVEGGSAGLRAGQPPEA